MGIPPFAKSEAHRKLYKSAAWFEGYTCGIPHLAKNERDVGHPTVGSGREAAEKFGTGQQQASAKARSFSFPPLRPD